MAVGGLAERRGEKREEDDELASEHLVQHPRMRALARCEAAEPVMRYQYLRRERGQETVVSPVQLTTKGLATVSDGWLT